MNIQKLLRKLDKKSIESKKQLLTVQAAYKIKTSESIGTLADPTETSFVITEAFTPQNRRGVVQVQTQDQDFSANSKLDEELSNIERMKNLYEGGQNRNRVRNNSFERSSASGKKSSEKHLLKPSNTPSFHKVSKLRISDQDQSVCKNLYTDPMLQNSKVSQISQTPQVSTSKNIERKHYFQYPDSSLQAECQDHEPYEEEPSYNEECVSQVISTQQLPPQEKSKEVEQSWHTESNVYAESNRGQNNSSQAMPCCMSSCVPREEVNGMMAALEAKIEALVGRVGQLEIQNSVFKKNYSILSNEHQALRLVLTELRDDRERAASETLKHLHEKEELEGMLKDVLYRREREKLQCSKQNTYRQNERSEKKGNISYLQSQSTNQLKPTRILSSVVQQPRQSESKMKVQNLLQKLQIKVDRN